MKALGITAMILAIIAIFIPGISLFITWVALIMAAIAASDKDASAFVWATMVVGALNTFLFSPLTLATITAAFPMLLLTLALFAAPIIVYMMKGSSSSVKVMRS